MGDLNLVREYLTWVTGVWISFHTLDIIRLFHTETLQVLQDINVASPIGRMVTGRL